MNSIISDSASKLIHRLGSSIKLQGKTPPVSQLIYFLAVICFPSFCLLFGDIF